VLRAQADTKFPSAIRFAALLVTLVAAPADAVALEGVRTAIVGGGASGLLLAHRLLDEGATVSLFESRADPRHSNSLEGRAYALGLGLRGRTALRTVDERLWKDVAASGFASDRFTLHLPFGSFDLRKPDPAQEPSILIYQTALCSAMLSSLEERHAASGRLFMNFGCRVETVDARTGAVCVAPLVGSAPAIETFDLVCGCDGVNSAVRAAVAEQSLAFNAELTTLPGSLKVLRLDAMPSTLTPDAVHLVPGAGGMAAFLEPTANGACALISWQTPTGRSDGHSDAIDPGALTDADETRRFLASSFPLISIALNQTDVGAQFVAQRISRASTVRCNTYHFGQVVLLGDAAHSTGGASGQGCNSALADAAALATMLTEARARRRTQTPAAVAAALARYSRERLPEGHALLDLSVGPSRALSPLSRLLGVLGTLKDTLLFKLGVGEPPLQTLLTTSLKSFAQIRREREWNYGPFPTDAEFDAQIARATATEEQILERV
jgi:kynurenine 3-monooxygenase